VAEQDEERTALDNRYQAAVADAGIRGIERNLRDFEAAIMDSKAVLAWSLEALHQFATDGKQLYATYYQLVEAGLRRPELDKQRELTDVALFSGYKQHIRFAALSLDRIGLSNYGSCHIVLRSNLIEHRASVFEENSVTWMVHHDFRMSKMCNLPPGHRAVWNERNKLAVAKLANKIKPNTPPNSYSILLLKQGATREDDHFIEVHICGPMTVRTFEHVTIKQPKKRTSRAILNALRKELDKVGVTMEVNDECSDLGT
jgi:hypothetical protein